MIRMILRGIVRGLGAFHPQPARLSRDEDFSASLDASMRRAALEAGVTVSDRVAGAQALAQVPPESREAVFERGLEIYGQHMKRESRLLWAYVGAQFVTAFSIMVALLILSSKGVIAVWRSTDGLAGIPYIAAAGVLAILSIAIGSLQDRLVELP